MNLFDFFNFFSHAHHKRKQADVPLCGRSMVEMLGVLAIIGVLSVGAIAGYSKAMFKYKLNKQTEQISTILYNSLTSAEQFSPPPPNPGTSSVEDMMPIYIKLGYIPVEMIKPRLTDNVFDAFNNNIYVKYINWDTSPSQKYLELTVWFSTPDVAQCMNILTLFKAMRENLYLAFIYRSYENSDNNSFISRMAGNILCANKYNTYPCLKNITISEMQHLCDVCAETQSCRLSVQYNHTN